MTPGRRAQGVPKPEHLFPPITHTHPSTIHRCAITRASSLGHHELEPKLIPPTPLLWQNIQQRQPQERNVYLGSQRTPLGRRGGVRQLAALWVLLLRKRT